MNHFFERWAEIAGVKFHSASASVGSLIFSHEAFVRGGELLDEIRNHRRRKP